MPDPSKPRNHRFQSCLGIVTDDDDSKDPPIFLEGYTDAVPSIGEVVQIRANMAHDGRPKSTMRLYSHPPFEQFPWADIDGKYPAFGDGRQTMLNAEC